jgi:Cu-Zn family superoxide dismutase
MYKTLAAIIPLVALCSCQTVPEGVADQLGAATIADSNGNPMGTARLIALGDEVTVNIALLAPARSGIHAVHLHQTGNCTAADFTSAGGHLNPAGAQHGSLNPQGAHLGDLPNITLSAAGAGSASATLKGTRASVLSAIFDADGTAIVVHAAADDYRTDPTGGAGARIGCGAFTRM